MADNQEPDHALTALLENNVEWADRIREEDPEFFPRLSRLQKPEYLWIGCADSRVPANEIVGLLPGELFVHRNIANVVVHTDMNCMSVLQYAVEALKVKHVIVCGHYGCGGVKAAMENNQLGMIDSWLRHIKDVYFRNVEAMAPIKDEQERLDRLCELNVKAQVYNCCYSTIVQKAWARGQPLKVHGWIYGLADGRLKDLNVTVSGMDDIPSIYRMDGNGQA